MGWIADPDIWVGFLTLLALEVVLGIDNVVFISILAGKLPPEMQEKARRVGLGLALIMRIVLLLALSWVIGLTGTLFEAFNNEISGRDLILILGGLFLLGKSTYEIHDKLEAPSDHKGQKVAASFGAVIIQVVLLDIVFSLDSVITAVGMVDEIGVMIAAVTVAIGIMLISAGAIGRFVEGHPTVKILALSFLLLIGVSLLMEGLDAHIPKGYIYFAMAFSLGVEMLNLRMKSVSPVNLHKRYEETTKETP